MNFWKCLTIWSRNYHSKTFCGQYPGFSGYFAGYSGLHPDSPDIHPDSLEGKFFWRFRCDRSDRSVRPVWPVHPGNCHLPSPRCKKVKIFSLFTVLPPTSPLFHPCAAPLHIPLSIFTPLEIWSSSPRILCFITCIGAKREKSISGEVVFEVPHEFISLPRYHIFPSPDLLA